MKTREIIEYLLKECENYSDVKIKEKLCEFVEADEYNFLRLQYYFGKLTLVEIYEIILEVKRITSEGIVIKYEN